MATTDQAPPMNEQEFRIHAWRPIGAGPRSTNTYQEEDNILVYAKGVGIDLKARMGAALKRTKEVLGSQGWDRFMVSLTIGDQEKRDARIERELDERRFRELAQLEEQIAC